MYATLVPVRESNQTKGKDMYDDDECSHNYPCPLARIPVTSPRESRGWYHIGDVPVDAGCLTLIDPCYLLSSEPTGGTNADPYAEILDNFAQLDEYGYQSVAGCGIVFSTGYGDGSYPVFARFEDGRVMEVRVVME